MNNKLGILPATGRDDNDVLALHLQQVVNGRLEGRFILRQSDEDAVSPYLITRVVRDSHRPTLFNTACRNRYGVLFEITAGYRLSYGTVLQTDVVCEIARALFEVYGPP